ncbi:MAG: hypothetical protein J6U54_12270 [Clostridiales bacterium]|nr:hypothetical protein [Clostridiales bacterium]
MEENKVWTCECGTPNMSKFCINCGKPMPEQPVVSEPAPFKPAPSQDAATQDAVPQVAPSLFAMNSVTNEPKTETKAQSPFKPAEQPSGEPQPFLQQTQQPEVSPFKPADQTSGQAQPYIQQQQPIQAPQQPQTNNQQFIMQPTQTVQQPAQPRSSDLYVQPAPTQSYQSQAYYVNESAVEDRNAKLATRFCIISLCCHLVGPVIASILGVIGAAMGDSSESMSSLASLIAGPTFTASIVFMIIARVKNKKSTFGKVLMWIYIVEVALLVVAVIAMIIFFIWLAQTCNM